MALSADLSIAMVAGEASGDILAGRMLSGLCPMLSEVHLYGIGGPAMAEHGFVQTHVVGPLWKIKATSCASEVACPVLPLKKPAPLPETTLEASNLHGLPGMGGSASG